MLPDAEKLNEKVQIKIVEESILEQAQLIILILFLFLIFIRHYIPHSVNIEACLIGILKITSKVIRN